VHPRNFREEPIAILISDGVEIAPSDREAIADANHVWGEEQALSVEEVRNSSSYAFYLPRAPHSYERVGVHVKYRGSARMVVARRQCPGSMFLARAWNSRTGRWC